MNRENVGNELTAHLVEQGFSDFEIARILQQVMEYERNTVHDSILESFENGTFSLDAIIRQIRS